MADVGSPLQRSRSACSSFIILAAVAQLVAAERASKVPKLTAPVLFNTPQADQILAAVRLCPADSPWHEDIRRLVN